MTDPVFSSDNSKPQLSGKQLLSIKFMEIVRDIIVTNISNQESLRAIDVWRQFLAEDRDLTKAFKATKQNISEL